MLDTFQLQDIKTEGSYLTDLGRPEAARAEKEAAIAEAAARREVRAGAHQGRGGDRDREPRAQPAQGRRSRPRPTPPRRRRSPPARSPRRPRTRRSSRRRRLVAERMSGLKERELDTEVRKPADAERYAVEQKAEADKTQARPRGRGRRASHRSRPRRPRPRRTAWWAPASASDARSWPRRSSWRAWRRAPPSGRVARRRRRGVEARGRRRGGVDPGPWRCRGDGDGEEGHRVRAVRPGRDPRPARRDAAPAREGGRGAAGQRRQDDGHLHRRRQPAHQERRAERHPGPAARERPARHRPRGAVPQPREPGRQHRAPAPRPPPDPGLRIRAIRAFAIFFGCTTSAPTSPVCARRPSRTRTRSAPATPSTSPVRWRSTNT